MDIGDEFCEFVNDFQISFLQYMVDRIHHNYALQVSFPF